MPDHYTKRCRAMEKSHVILNLARQDFRIVCQETPEYMKALEGAVNSRIERIQKKYPSMSTMRCVLLAMLDMQDDLYKAGLEGDFVQITQSPENDEEDDF